MKALNFILFLLFTSQILFAQKTAPKQINEYAPIDKKALQIPDSLTKTTDGIAEYIKSNFTTNTEKLRAIFIWVATNIQYDIDNMFAINFYEKEEDKISKPLKTRKGICENYAALFDDICKKSGIKSFVIEGYTKQNGFADYIPHAWCAALIDTSWFMFDPTWGSGYVYNKKFVKKINNQYFKAPSSLLIKSHMPFDYLWQFLNYPITNQEFYEGNVQQNKSKTFFNYKDSIAAYEKENDLDQTVSAAERVEKNGVKNSLIYDWLQHLKLKVEYIKQSTEHERLVQIAGLYNQSVYEYNDAIHYFNEFIKYRNHQFIPMKTDVEIQSMLDTPDNKLKSATERLNGIKNPEEKIAASILQLNKTIDDLKTHVLEQQDWLKKYFSKNKSGRKSMFVKYTWFGIPLNKN